MNTFHDLYVLFLANRDRGVEFVKNSPGAYTRVFSTVKFYCAISVYTAYSVNTPVKKDTIIKGGRSFSQTLHGCLTNVDRRMHFVVTEVHNWVHLVFTRLCLEVVSRGVMGHAR